MTTSATKKYFLKIYKTLKNQWFQKIMQIGTVVAIDIGVYTK